MSTPTKSGIKTSADGASFIPASRRADGSTRKEIRVRPGYKPPEDVETYKNRSAEAFKTRGNGAIPGAESPSKPSGETEIKNKNAKRREAAKRRAAVETTTDSEITNKMEQARLDDGQLKELWNDPTQLAGNQTQAESDDQERQKKIRNLIKKLKAVRELKEKKSLGEKLSPDQIMKMSKEDELLRDLKKLNYDGPEIQESASNGPEAEAATEARG